LPFIVLGIILLTYRKYLETKIMKHIANSL
jgi:hypothetical protein